VSTVTTQLRFGRRAIDGRRSKTISSAKGKYRHQLEVFGRLGWARWSRKEAKLGELASIEFVDALVLIFAKKLRGFFLGREPSHAAVKIENLGRAVPAHPQSCPHEVREG
jgi:hypothetical protein